MWWVAQRCRVWRLTLCLVSNRGSKEAVLRSHHGLQQRSAGHRGTGKLWRSTDNSDQENACRLFEGFSGHRWAHIFRYLYMNHVKFRSIDSPCNNTNELTLLKVKLKLNQCAAWIDYLFEWSHYRRWIIHYSAQAPTALHHSGAMIQLLPSSLS